MDREEAIRLLKGGIEGIREFNRRRHSGEEFPSLAEAQLEEQQFYFIEAKRPVTVDLGKAERFDRNWIDLRSANLRAAQLTFADLSKAGLSRANLHEAELSGADLSGAELDDADLSGANLERANLSEADLRGANLNGANLRTANLSRANFRNADLSGATMLGANLSGAVLFLANLNTAKLNYAQLSGTSLDEVNLSDADLRRTTGLLLDNTFIRHARFDARAKDPWSVLRRSYTGPALLFNLIFLCTFLGVYAAKAAFWLGVNRSQQAGLELAEKLASTHPQLAEGLRALEPTLTEHSHKMAVWQVLLSMDREPWLMILAVVLIVYNAVRWFLTRQVAAMRDAEERSGFSPHWIGEEGDYCWCWLLHKWVARPLFWIAVVSFLWHAWYWLTETVYLPK